METLQPTREIYSRGTCSSSGTGSPENCYRAEGGAERLKPRNVQRSLGSAREASQPPAPSPFPAAQPSPALNEAVGCIVAFVTCNYCPCSSCTKAGEPLLPLYGRVWQPWPVGAFLLPPPTASDPRASTRIDPKTEALEFRWSGRQLGTSLQMLAAVLFSQ